VIQAFLVLFTAVEVMIFSMGKDATYITLPNAAA